MKISKSTYAWVVVVLLLFVWMLNYLDRQVIFSIFPLLQSELHISTFQMGLLARHSFGSIPSAARGLGIWLTASASCH